ncbi:ankyrin repeat domain-containing protein [Mesorhizobium sp. BR1-1-13]|uniref:ankyrin repeat domain-containing protein n=1 Tax=Mesorhizobium sp. BR1-1-13 TaxID=2876656 RepID=UPI001CD13EC3|nr:ankyrin repeat domain-containing protein [Mesorhizobium sp. BR1-1-13]MBZ9944512.1 ankyrin repeat domain-containing protein [Mesorhizobium sp. BR1-1-13]
MNAKASRSARKGDSAGTARLNADLLQAAYLGDLSSVARAIDDGADIDCVHEQTGLNPLHIAVGTNNLALTKFFIDAGALIGPDRSGRWPTVIAAECRADENLCDYIVEEEAKLLAR